MDKQLEHQIIDILAQLDQDTDIPTLHVVLMDAETMEHEQVIESTVEAPIEQEIPEVRPFEVSPTPPSNHPSIYWLVAGLSTLPTLVLISLLFLPALLPVVRVTIQPVTRVITVQTEITVVTGQIIRPDQIAGRLLSSGTLKETRTIATTSTVHQDAQVATGRITFYNASLSTQIIAAGTLLVGASGISIVTDETAVTPAGTLSTNGQTTVLAHAVEPGLSGNIEAFDLYGPCCRVNVFVTNGDFTGGQAATTYQVVSEQDIKQAEQAVKADLEKNAQAALISQVEKDETLITPPSCTSLVTPDHKVGEQATQVTVTVEQQCQTMTYQTKAMQTAMQTVISEHAASELGTGYARTGEVETSVIKEIAVTPDQRVLTVQATSQWVYQFEAYQLEQMKRLIAGKGTKEATALLHRHAGVAGVMFDTEEMNMLPVKPERIDLRIGFA